MLSCYLCSESKKENWTIRTQNILCSCAYVRLQRVPSPCMHQVSRTKAGLRISFEILLAQALPAASALPTSKKHNSPLHQRSGKHSCIWLDRI